MRESTNNEEIFFPYKAAIVYFVGTCNLKCRYCFQPKIMDHMTPVNEKIIEWIRSGKLEDDLYQKIGPDNLVHLSLWGGEPSINLPYLEERIESIILKFPNLEEINFSTNISTRKLTENLISFCKKIDFFCRLYSRSISLKIQFSLDGPSEINDYNRIGCTAEDLKNNVAFLLKEIRNLSLIKEKRIKFNLKGTQSAYSLKWLTEDGNLEKFYQYFIDCYNLWDEVCEGKHIYPTHGEAINVVGPGTFTQQDGYNFLKLINILHSKSFRSKFKEDIKQKYDLCFTTQFEDGFRNLALHGKILDRFPGTISLHNSCNCCAGSSALSITYNGSYHICQSSFFFDDETLDYIEKNNLVSEFEELHGYSFKNYKNYLKDRYVVIPDKEKADKSIKEREKQELLMSRAEYLVRSFHMNIPLRLQYHIMIIKELAAAGQISPIFLKEKAANAAATYFLYQGSDCPSNNAFAFGSIYIKDMSQFKLLLNGAFEKMCELYNNLMEDKKGNENELF